MPVVFEWLGVGTSIDPVASALLRSVLNNTPRDLPPEVTDIVEIVPAGKDRTDSWSQRVNLSGYEYTILFEWNDRVSAWYISLLDENEDFILEGKKLAVEQDVLHSLTAEKRPPGALACYEISGALTRPTRESLGVLHRLIYLT